MSPSRGDIARKQINPLAREDIDAVVSSMSAADMLEATEDETGKRRNGTKMLRIAFDAAAERAGYGPNATERVPVALFRYYAESMGGAVNVDSPLASDTSALLDSAATGE
jgi:hypothetical protein